MNDPSRRMIARQGPPTPALGLATLAAVAVTLLGVTGQNPPQALLSAAVLALGIILLWRPGEPPVLLFLFALPWVQASISIFHAAWLGQDLPRYSPISGQMQTAVNLSLLGVAAMAIGMRWGAGALLVMPGRIARVLALTHPMPRWCWLYLAASIIGYGASFASNMVPGLFQVTLAIANLRWAFFFMLAYAGFVRREATSPFFVLPFLLEFGLGVGGFFSDFKTVFLVTVLAFAASGLSFSPRSLFGLTVLASMLVALMVSWTAIKGEYRAFVSGGDGTQAVRVDYATGIEKLASLVHSLDAAAMTNAADHLVRRISYVEFFGAAIDYVPTILPHQNGALIIDAVVRPFMPRLFFPNKTVINDTERTNLFTGGLAGNAEATSISLGYIAECYIDLGEIWMFAALLAIGFFYGRIYRSLISSPGLVGPLGMGLAAAVLLTVGSLDNSFTKVFGGVVVALLASWLLQKLVVPRLCPWISPAASGRRAGRPVPPPIPPVRR